MANVNIKLKKSNKKSKKNKEFIKIQKETEPPQAAEETSVEANTSGISLIESSKNSKKGIPKARKPFDPKKIRRGVILIRGLPHGFYETQLEQFFGQFGAVTRTRVGRSKRTGNSKGFAYVEFRVPEVAKIAAETMDNYLMFKKRLRTIYIPPHERKYNLFYTSLKHVEVDGEIKLTSDVIERREKIIQSYNKTLTDEQHQKKIKHFEHLINKAKIKYEVIDGVKVDPVIYRQADKIFTSLAQAGKEVGNKFIKPANLIIHQEYKIIHWQIIDTKYGDRLQVTLEETGMLILPDRMLKALGVAGLGNNIIPPKGATLRYLGKDPEKFNACIYDMYIKPQEIEEQAGTEFDFLQDTQKW